MKLQVGVKLVIKNSKNEILLIQRSEKDAVKKAIRPKWEIPGGRIEPSETLVEALAREVHEEIGVKINSEVRLLAAQDIFANEDLHVVRLTYSTTIDDVDIKLSDEHQAWRWANAAEIKQLEIDSYLTELINNKK